MQPVRCMDYQPSGITEERCQRLRGLGCDATTDEGNAEGDGERCGERKVEERGDGNDYRCKTEVEGLQQHRERCR